MGHNIINHFLKYYYRHRLDHCRKTSTQKLGYLAEIYAKYWLNTHDISTLLHRYRCHLGEIDLLMFDQQTLIAVEVKFRSADLHVEQYPVLRTTQLNRIAQAMTHFLSNHPIQFKNHRIDLIHIVGSQKQPLWLKGIG